MNLSFPLSDLSGYGLSATLSCLVLCLTIADDSMQRYLVPI